MYTYVFVSMIFFPLPTLWILVIFLSPIWGHQTSKVSSMVFPHLVTSSDRLTKFYYRRLLHCPGWCGPVGSVSIPRIKRLLGSIPGHGTCLVVSSIPGKEHSRGSQWIFFSHMDVSHSFSFPISLQINNFKKDYFVDWYNWLFNSKVNWNYWKIELTKNTDLMSK